MQLTNVFGAFRRLRLSVTLLLMHFSILVSLERRKATLSKLNYFCCLIYEANEPVNVQNVLAQLGPSCQAQYRSPHC
jgi:hypothetical protein